ncbi:FKBP-type peptidyl-prolyl cis-trans isomerase [Burkholderiaceae bacterium FT117]|uniref:FKBP-type peptidyl-prolyl cis-trans isomerase n=1 Tax=Zeimonas sediminis TaxID=2944268 RepID=UPI0023430348|nr:FKBP-type peptidyl-prolyl cis-trans isomerase [Zeimonas sediminis]MCM5572241.1 FKBP-type peptidyl-prolyl cis-trans isomerase [Zeimonas sediminis]
MNTRSPDASPGDAGSPARVAPGSYLTLHYRLSLAESGADVINTFVERPATLQLGLGQMAEPLERCLLGLADGAHEIFELEADDAFGPRNPELVQKLSRATFDANVEPGSDYQPGDLVEFPTADGGRFAGVLKELTERYALFDFNHPLAGQRVRFEVRILGIL